jgi:hypothetical protein
MSKQSFTDGIRKTSYEILTIIFGESEFYQLGDYAFLSLLYLVKVSTFLE